MTKLMMILVINKYHK